MARSTRRKSPKKSKSRRRSRKTNIKSRRKNSYMNSNENESKQDIIARDLEKVKHEPSFIKNVTYYTPEICMAAVIQDGDALEYVPDNMKTPEMCLIAVKQNGINIMLVPKRMQTFEICLSAIQEDIEAINYIYDQTPEIRSAAIQLYPNNRISMGEKVDAEWRRYRDSSRGIY